MDDFVVPHGLEDRPAPGVGLRQSTEVVVDVAVHLALGLGHEAEADAVTEAGRHGTDGEGSGVPQRPEQAGPGIEFAEALLAPGEVVGFLAGGLEQHVAEFRGPGERRLAMVERLGGHFSGMVDPHERRGFAPFGRGQRFGFRSRPGPGQGPRGRRGGENGTQRAVRGGQDAIKR